MKIMIAAVVFWAKHANTPALCINSHVTRQCPHHLQGYRCSGSKWLTIHKFGLSFAKESG